MNIGILLIATNKYIQFINPLYESIKKYFMIKHKVHVYVFTNEKINYQTGLIPLQIQHEPWPAMTLKRYHIFNQYKHTIDSQDYLLYMDVDMLIKNYIEDDILGNLIGTLHPYQNEKVPNCTYENKNSVSTAYIPKGQGKYYFAGGFQGGKTKNFLEMSDKLAYNINMDQKIGYTAIWHDESYYNQYMYENEPDKILSSDYCTPEGKEKETTKIIALNKNHSEFRN